MGKGICGNGVAREAKNIPHPSLAHHSFVHHSFARESGRTIRSTVAGDRPPLDGKLICPRSVIGGVLPQDESDHMVSQTERILEQLYWHSIDSVASLEKTISEDTSHGKTTSELCSAYLKLAETQILLRGDVETGRHSLRCVGRVLLDFLSRRAVNDIRFCCIGFDVIVDACFAVLTAADVSLFREIVCNATQHAFVQCERSSVEFFTWKTLVALVKDDDPLIDHLIVQFRAVTRRERFCIGYPVVVDGIAKRDSRLLDVGLDKINVEFEMDRRRSEPNFGYEFALPVVAYYNLAIAIGISARLGFDSEWVPVELLSQG